MPFQFRLNLESELRRILGEVDIAVTSCAGYPLDTTYYQAAKAVCAQLEGDGFAVEYFDVDTVEGMAEAAQKIVALVKE